MTKTHRELLAEQRDLDARIAAAREAERGRALATIRELMAQFDIAVAELASKRGPKKSGPYPAKYRDPVSGATGSGKGREPRWIAGKDRSQFEIG